MRDNFNIIFDDKEGYSIKSKKTGKIYALLEGISYRGGCSSDIVFIMETDPEQGYTNLVNYSFGAYFKEDLIDSAISYIEDYEAKLCK